MQLRLWHMARSVLSNWIATGATLAVGFLLQPFVVHRLGDVAYGVWVLAISLTSYLMMLDLGMASSVLRFISQGYASQDHESASDALSAVLWIRLQISLVILGISGGFALIFPHLIKVSPSLALEARKALLVIGVTTAISMSFGVFSATLSALNRYDLRSYVSLTQVAIRVTGVVVVLRSGHGILAIAFCELLAALVANGLLFYLARKIYPELKIHLNKPKRDVLSKIWSYSVYAFLITIAVQLVYQSDNIVVGAFLSASAVTFYSIGNTLCRYTQQVIGSMTATFCPAASTYEAAGETASLRALYYNGTRATLAISLPIVMTLIIRGDTFIGLWMGPQYSRSSGTVLAILATALLFSLQNTTAGAMALGLAKHKTTAWWAIAEGIANLALSIGLAHKFGIYGVAIGTMVPSMIIHLIMWPQYVSQLVDVSWLQVYLRVWGPVFLCVVPFSVASYAVDRLLPPHKMVLFFLQTAALLTIFTFTVCLMFRDNVKRQILPRMKSFLHAPAK